MVLDVGVAESFGRAGRADKPVVGEMDALVGVDKRDATFGTEKEELFAPDNSLPDNEDFDQEDILGCGMGNHIGT